MSFTTYLRAQDDDNYTYSRPEYAALSDSALTLIRETNLVISEEEREADAIAREFVHGGSSGSSQRVTDDGYVSTEDAADAWLRENDRAAYVALDDSTATVSDDLGQWAHTPNAVWVDGVQMNVVDLTQSFEKMFALQNMTLNVWNDAAGNICIGSVRIAYLPTGNPVATCVKCKQTLIYRGESEYDQQTFVLGCITHGHNHSSKGAWVEVERVERTVITDRDAYDPETRTSLFGKIVERPYKMRVFFERSHTPIYGPVAERIHNAERDAYDRALQKSK